MNTYVRSCISLCVVYSLHTTARKKKNSRDTSTRAAAAAAAGAKKNINFGRETPKHGASVREQERQRKTKNIRKYSTAKSKEMPQYIDKHAEFVSMCAYVCSVCVCVHILYVMCQLVSEMCGNTEMSEPYQWNS